MNKSRNAAMRLLGTGNGSSFFSAHSTPATVEVHHPEPWAIDETPGTSLCDYAWRANASNQGHQRPFRSLVDRTNEFDARLPGAVARLG